jgi:pyrroline-5-carboxylate reductase
MRFGVIGGGVIGEALISTLLGQGIVSENILVAEKNSIRSSYLFNKYSCQIVELLELTMNASTIFICVKPQDLAQLMEHIGPSIEPRQKVLSFVAGKSTSTLESYLPVGVPVFRIMPNTPLVIHEGVSAVSSGKYASENDVEYVKNLLSGTGTVLVVDESFQNAVTATSGSGPAYVFKFIESMINGAIELGLPEHEAHLLVIQTVRGACQMLYLQDLSPAEQSLRVTSPGGTTFAALGFLETADFEGTIKGAMRAAYTRSIELSQ